MVQSFSGKPCWFFWENCILLNYMLKLSEICSNWHCHTKQFSRILCILQKAKLVWGKKQPRFLLKLKVRILSIFLRNITKCVRIKRSSKWNNHMYIMNVFQYCTILKCSGRSTFPMSTDKLQCVIQWPTDRGHRGYHIIHLMLRKRW